MNYQILPNGSYDYIHVGDWNNGSLQIREDIQISNKVEGAKVESVCSKPCAPGFYRVSFFSFPKRVLFTALLDLDLTLT